MQYAKRGRLRFTSHRDFARAFERALRRAEVPMAYSGGFSPHPKISYVGAAPTGVASEAEYLEIGLSREADPDQVRDALDAALPDGLDIVSVVQSGGGSLPERIQASHWHIELPGVSAADAVAALTGFMARDEVPVERRTKDGMRTVDARAAVVSADVVNAADAHDDGCGEVRRAGDPATRAILAVVVRQATPAVRPDDILAALRIVAGLAPDAPPVAVRVAQGPIDETGAISDPLASDRPPVRTTP